jgi:hypothetical protein
MADALCRLVVPGHRMDLALFGNAGHAQGLLQADPARLPSYVPADLPEEEKV